jgi:hypothetical protein|tara:strand:- start:1748 stop:2005 length:258 start_codon:yes stop_codon:yes gene_type:complete
MNKRVFILQTLDMMRTTLDDPSMTKSIEKIKDTVAHSAPEILDGRWYKIYAFCTQFVNDEDNPKHLKCFNIYNDRLKEYGEIKTI